MKKTYSHKWNYGHFHPLIYIICFFCTSIISFIFVTFLNLCYFHYYFLFDPSTHPTPYHILALYYMLQYQCNSENRLFIHLLFFFLHNIYVKVDKTTLYNYFCGKKWYYNCEFYFILFSVSSCYFCLFFVFLHSKFKFFLFRTYTSLRWNIQHVLYGSTTIYPAAFWVDLITDRG